jgi:hypothetical protein
VRDEEQTRDGVKEAREQEEDLPGPGLTFIPSLPSHSPPPRSPHSLFEMIEESLSNCPGLGPSYVIYVGVIHRTPMLSRPHQLARCQCPVRVRHSRAAAAHGKLPGLPDDTQAKAVQCSGRSRDVGREGGEGNGAGTVFVASVESRSLSFLLGVLFVTVQ